MCNRGSEYRSVVVRKDPVTVHRIGPAHPRAGKDYGHRDHDGTRGGKGRLECTSFRFASIGIHFALGPLQIGAHLRCTLIPETELLLESLVYDSFQNCWHARVKGSNGAWCSIQNAVDD